MEDALRYGAIQMVDDVEDVVKGLAAMHDERNAQLMAPVQLDVESMLLLLTPGLVPIQVDADFANGHDGITVERGAHALQHVKVIIMHVLGVQAQSHRAIIRVLFMQCRNARNTLKVLVGQDDVSHTRLASPGNNLVTVVVKRITINM